VRAGAKEMGIKAKNNAARLTSTGVAGNFCRIDGLLAIKLIQNL
jgi:hypothetical protein